MLFKSAYPDIHVPSNVTLWQWLFEGPSPAAGCSRREAFLKREFINVHTRASFTHAQVRDAAAALSTALARRHGLQAGDNVLLVSPNGITYPIVTHGVMRAGGIPAFSPPTYNETEMLHALRTVNSRFVMCSPEALPVVRAAARQQGIDESRIFVFNDDNDHVDGFLSLSELVEDGKKLGVTEAAHLPKGKHNSEATAFLCFSSGTTGLPKAVIISHSNIIAQCLQLNLAYANSHTCLAVMPFYHVSGLVRFQIHAFVSHTTVAVMAKFTMPVLLDTISTYRIPEVNLVPPILIRLAHEPTVDNYDLSCVSRWTTGAAPVSPEVLDLLAKRFPGTGFKQGYGMTETTASAVTHPKHMYDFKYGRSVGTLVPSTMARVVNEDGVAVGVDEHGEIRLKGPQIVPGYYNNPAATAESFDEEGFLRTGDVGSIAADGLITIHDRIKEMIKVKGSQVAPAELEDLLLGHAKVADAAVFGVPDDYAGERPYAFVVLQPGVDNSRGQVAEELMQFVKDERTRNKWLAGVRIVDAIPKSPSGKILRRILKEEYKKDFKMPSPRL
ncbi:hypothetical protein PWT90_09145 [Aphanocladium album]|nr:hypothetical protein PWT90_09145 [Aphanocladium album]